MVGPETRELMKDVATLNANEVHQDIHLAKIDEALEELADGMRGITTGLQSLKRAVWALGFLILALGNQEILKDGSILKTVIESVAHALP